MRVKIGKYEFIFTSTWKSEKSRKLWQRLLRWELCLCAVVLLGVSAWVEWKPLGPYYTIVLIWIMVAEAVIVVEGIKAFIRTYQVEDE